MSTTGSSRNAVAYPASIHGRLDSEKGFSTLVASADELSDFLKREINETALSGWGSKPNQLDYDIESVGHFRSRVDPSLMHILCVRPLAGRQPVRAVVTVPLFEYRRFGCNPFVFVRAGFFEFLDAFVANPITSGVCAPAMGPTFADDPPPAGAKQWDEASLAAAISPLLRGESRIIASSTASQTTQDMIEAIVWAMPIELRSTVTILSYAFIDRAAVEKVTPALVGMYDRNAPAEPRRDDLGDPSSRAMTEILIARQAREGVLPYELGDGRLLHLHELILSVQARLDQLSKSAAVPAETLLSISSFEGKLASLRATIDAHFGGLDGNELNGFAQANSAMAPPSTNTSRRAENHSLRGNASRSFVWATAAASVLIAVALSIALNDETNTLNAYLGELEAKVGIRGVRSEDTLTLRLERVMQEVNALSVVVSKLNNGTGSVERSAANMRVKEQAVLDDATKGRQVNQAWSNPVDVGHSGSGSEESGKGQEPKKSRGSDAKTTGERGNQSKQGAAGAAALVPQAIVNGHQGAKTLSGTAKEAARESTDLGDAGSTSERDHKIRDLQKDEAQGDAVTATGQALEQSQEGAGGTSPPPKKKSSEFFHDR